MVVLVEGVGLWFVVWVIGLWIEVIEGFAWIEIDVELFGGD